MKENLIYHFKKPLSLQTNSSEDSSNSNLVSNALLFPSFPILKHLLRPLTTLTENHTSFSVKIKSQIRGSVSVIYHRQQQSNLQHFFFPPFPYLDLAGSLTHTDGRVGRRERKKEGKKERGTKRECESKEGEERRKRERRIEGRKEGVRKGRENDGGREDKAPHF